MTPGEVSYSVEKGKATPPEGESKKASCRKWHLSLALKKESRERHSRDMKQKTKAASRVGLQLPEHIGKNSHTQRKLMEKGLE